MSGLILSLYTALGGPAGAYGAPLSDVTVSGNVSHRQKFENGYDDLLCRGHGGSGSTQPASSRHFTAFPRPLCQVAVCNLSVSGFANGDTVTVSVTNQPEFYRLHFPWVLYLELRGPNDRLRWELSTLQAVDTAWDHGVGIIRDPVHSQSRCQTDHSEGQFTIREVSARIARSASGVRQGFERQSDSQRNGYVQRFSRSLLSVTSALTDTTGLASTTLRCNRPQELPSSTPRP